MAKSGTVMKSEGVDVTWVSDVPMSVKTDGSVEVDIVIAGGRAPGVWNERENTKVVCPDFLLRADTVKQPTLLLESLVHTEHSVNAKHFVVTNQAKEYLRALNAKDFSYTDDLVKRTNLFCVDLEKKHEFKSIAPDLKIDIVQPDDMITCAELSKFQQERLQEFRKLAAGTTTEKIKDRYSLDAFLSRVSSPEIIVFIIRKESNLLGTFTLNLHITFDAPESERFGYLSDLFVAEGLENDANFIKQFMSGVFSEIERRHPKVKVLSVMAAAGDPTIPIVKCFNHAKEAKLIHLFTRLEQERLGVVAQFTLKESNNGKTHFPPLPLGIVSRLSLIAEIRRRSDQKEDSAVSLPTLRK